MMALTFSPHSAESNARFVWFGNDFCKRKRFGNDNFKVDSILAMSETLIMSK